MWRLTLSDPNSGGLSMTLALSPVHCLRRPSPIVSVSSGSSLLRHGCRRRTCPCPPRRNRLRRAGSVPIAQELPLRLRNDGLAPDWITGCHLWWRLSALIPGFLSRAPDSSLDLTASWILGLDNSCSFDSALSVVCVVISGRIQAGEVP